MNCGVEMEWERGRGVGRMDGWMEFTHAAKRKRAPPQPPPHMNMHQNHKQSRPPTTRATVPTRLLLGVLGLELRVAVREPPERRRGEVHAVLEDGEDLAAGRRE